MFPNAQDAFARRSRAIQSQQRHSDNRTRRVMLGPVQPTQYDLTFSLFGIPVRVSPMFWLMGVILGFDYVNAPRDGLLLLLIWVAVVFVSILVHELGHALTALAFGYPPRIMLYHFGGLAMFEPYRDYTTAKAILILLAGPGAGFLLFGISIAASLFLPDGRLTGETVDMLVWVNLFWGLLNLVPVLPLDGGQICREVCLSLNPSRGLTWALWISIVVGGHAGAGLFAVHMRFAAIMFLLLAVQSYQGTATPADMVAVKPAGCVPRIPQPRRLGRFSLTTNVETQSQCPNRQLPSCSTLPERRRCSPALRAGWAALLRGRLPKRARASSPPAATSREPKQSPHNYPRPQEHDTMLWRSIS